MTGGVGEKRGTGFSPWSDGSGAGWGEGLQEGANRCEEDGLERGRDGEDG